MVTEEDLQNALHVTVPSSQRGSDVLVDTKPVRWEDIGGLESVKAQVKQVCVLGKSRCDMKDKIDNEMRLGIDFLKTIWLI